MSKNGGHETVIVQSALNVMISFAVRFLKYIMCSCK